MIKYIKQIIIHFPPYPWRKCFLISVCDANIWVCMTSSKCSSEEVLLFYIMNSDRAQTQVVKLTQKYSTHWAILLSIYFSSFMCKCMCLLNIFTIRGNLPIFGKLSIGWGRKFVFHSKSQGGTLRPNKHFPYFRSATFSWQGPGWFSLRDASLEQVDARWENKLYLKI